MQKNIWMLMAAGILLSVAAFAGDETASTEGDTVPPENRIVAHVNNGDETASTEGDTVPSEDRVLACTCDGGETGSAEGDETASTECDDEPVNRLVAAC